MEALCQILKQMSLPIPKVGLIRAAFLWYAKPWGRAMQAN